MSRQQYADKQVVNVPLEPELLALVDDFRFTHRFPSRIAAIKWLMASRLEEKPTPKPEDVARFARAS
jgi:hypothetical protein